MVEPPTTASAHGKGEGLTSRANLRRETARRVKLDHDRLRRRDAPTLFTRVRPEHVGPLRAELPGATFDVDASLLAWPGEPPRAHGGTALVLAAGTSDLPVAQGTSRRRSRRRATEAPSD